MRSGFSFAALTDLVLPRACIGCGRGGTPWCAACRPRERPFAVWAGGMDVVAAGSYDGALRAAVIAYKERARLDLTSALGDLLGRAVRTITARHQAARPGARIVLVPMPSSAAAVRARRGDHLARLARVAARRCGCRVVPAVHLGRAVVDSAGLSRPERAANLRGAMCSAPAPGGVRAVLVDDVVTTGASLREARRAITAAGWQVCGAAVLAATPRHVPMIDASGTARPSGLPWG